MNQRLLRILGGKTEHYPHALENNYPRILENIMSLWDDDAIDNYFMELIVSNRGQRTGFPPDVAADILRLSLIHAAQEAPGKHKGIWDAPSDSFANFTPHPTSDWEDPAQHIKNELDKQGILCTPGGFFEAVEMGSRTAVALFIEAPSNLEIRDNRGWTPLMMAAFSGRDEIVSLLIQYKADVNALDLGGNSALHWAAFGGHISCAKQLIAHQARLNSCNNFGWTPLMQATARNHLEMVALLIASGTDLDAAANDGYTALHKAVTSGYSEIVQLLLDHGADKNLETSNGDTAEKLAVKNKLDDISKLLAGC
ncbi:MAG: ankyrin repeat domain-containing protein [Gallionella sp.]|jgi:ankyrin repeat protein